MLHNNVCRLLIHLLEVAWKVARFFPSIAKSQTLSTAAVIWSNQRIEKEKDNNKTTKISQSRWWTYSLTVQGPKIIQFACSLFEHWKTWLKVRSCYSRREVMTNTMRKSLKVNTNHTGESKVDLGRFLVVLGESELTLVVLGSCFSLRAMFRETTGWTMLKSKLSLLMQTQYKKCPTFNVFSWCIIHSKYTSKK